MDQVDDPIHESMRAIADAFSAGDLLARLDRRIIPHNCPSVQSELSPPADQAYGRGMEDMLAHLETLQVQIAECEMIHDLATDPVKRAPFTKACRALQSAGR